MCDKNMVHSRDLRVMSDVGHRNNKEMSGVHIVDKHGKTVIFEEGHPLSVRGQWRSAVHFTVDKDNNLLVVDDSYTNNKKIKV